MTNITEIKNYNVTMTENVNFNDMAEELDGLGSISLDSIKIPAGGGIMFEMPSDDPENPNVSKEIIGVVIDHHPVNSYWATAYNGENAIPDCVSMDGKTGYVTATGQCNNCANCPLNQFDPVKNGKACRNTHKLYILQQGDVMPITLNVPPSSLKNFKEYITKRVVLKGRKMSNVVTKLTLTKAKSASGITYSQLQFAKVQDLTPEQAASLKPMTDLCKVIGRRLPTPQTAQPQEQNPYESGAYFEDVEQL